MKPRRAGWANVAGTVALTAVAVMAGVALMLWAGDRLATRLIDALIKVMFWAFGFGWLAGSKL